MSDDEPDESCSELSLLTSWDNDFLSFNHSDLVDRSIRIFECFGFHNGDRLGVPREQLLSFVEIIARNYHSTNPYHNFHHAHSTLAIAANLIRNCSPTPFSCLEEFAVLLAALCHDVGHQGLNSDYYIKTRHELALQYNNMSVLENMHCSLSLQLLSSSDSTDFTSTWSEERKCIFKKTFIRCVLATDMKIHFELTNKVEHLDRNNISSLNAEDRCVLYEAFVHAADLANPVMPTEHCHQWAYRVVEEMFEQGKREEKQGFQVAPFMKHSPDEVTEFAKLQISFVTFIASPFWRRMADIWPSLDSRMIQLNANLRYWEALRDKSSEKKNETSHTTTSDVTRCDSFELKLN